MDDRLAASWRQARISEVRENLCELIEQAWPTRALQMMN